jgi:hypothetical protein
MNSTYKPIDPDELVDELADNLMLNLILKQGLLRLGLTTKDAGQDFPLNQMSIMQRLFAKLRKNMALPGKDWHISRNGMFYRRKVAEMENGIGR